MKQGVLTPVLEQAGLEVCYNGIKPIPYANFTGSYLDCTNFATLIAQKEQVKVIELLAEHGVNLSQELIELICERDLEWV